MNNFNIFIFDFEVFKYDWLLCLKNATTGEQIHIWNDRARLRAFVDKHIGNSIFIGFNSTRYDINIMKAIYGGLDPYALSQWMIAQGQQAFTFPGMRSSYFMPFYTFDLKNDCVKPHNMAMSLKEYEAYIGADIIESDIDFRIDRPLTEDEKVRTTKYCVSDVENSYLLFLEDTQQTEFEVQLMLCALINKPLHKTLHRTTAQLTAMILEAKKQTHYDEGDYELPSFIDIKNKSIVDFFTKTKTTAGMTLSTLFQNIEYNLGLGGIHGAIKNWIRKGKFMSIDVGSYYPSEAIEYDYLSRNVANKSKFKDIYDERMLLKKQGHKKANALKRVLNTTYGAQGNEYNDLYDEKNRRAICITGQLMLWELIEQLADYGFIFNANTDGIMIEILDDTVIPKIEAVVAAWEAKTKMKMEYEYYKHIIQGDVNNYIMVTEDNKIKLKGSYTKFSVADGKKPNNYSRQVRVLQDAVVNYFVHGIDPEETIRNNNNILDFQFVAKATHIYSKVVAIQSNEQDITINTPQTELQRVNRLFPTTQAGVKVFKFREFNGKPQYTKTANAPTNAFIYNNEIKNITDFKSFAQLIKLDWQWYIDEAWHRIKKFIGEEAWEELD